MRSEGGESSQEGEKCLAVVYRRQEGPEREITRNRDRNTRHIKFRHKFTTTGSTREMAVACAWCASNRNCEKGI